MYTLTSPLLRAPASHSDRNAEQGTDVLATDAEISTLVCLARSRHAHDLVIGSGRTPRAVATTRAIETAWERIGGRVLLAITWPETGASWLRHATRFAAPDPDLWVMTGPAIGWAQMTRRLLWSTSWAPARTLATAGIGSPQSLALVGLHNLEDLAGVYGDGTSWHVAHGALMHRPRVVSGP
ncbi:MAG: hypothetical protein ACRDRN_07220 [Sciscionella sp.]